MSREIIEIVPVAKTWRDISQPVKSRAMSRGGRWRHARATLKTTLALAVFAGLGWGVWTVANATSAKPATARAERLKPPVLVTDQALDAEWLKRVLALPADASLMNIDLGRLQGRVLADSQVLAAEITRQFPATLVVRVTERTPVARVEHEGRELLVARDGVMFAGTGYSPVAVDALPLLTDITLLPNSGAFPRVEGMAAVSDLLARAGLEAQHLYRTWGEVSLARLEGEREIEIKTRAPRMVTMIFKANDDVFRQLAKLNYVWNQLPAAPEFPVRIDLSLGWQVPVLVGEPAAAAAAAKRGTASFNAMPVSTSAIVFPNPQPRTKREL